MTFEEIAEQVNIVHEAKSAFDMAESALRRFLSERSHIAEVGFLVSDGLSYSIRLPKYRGGYRPDNSEWNDTEVQMFIKHLIDICELRHARFKAQKEVLLQLLKNSPDDFEQL